MVCLGDGLCDGRLVEGGIGAEDAVGESHPVEGGDVVLLGLLDEVFAELEELLGLLVIVVWRLVDIAGAPFTDNHWTLWKKVGVYLVDDIINLALAVCQSGVGVNFKGKVPFDGIGGCLEFGKHIGQVVVPVAIAIGRGVSVDDQVTLLVVAASSTDGIHETLGVTVESLVSGSGIVGIVAVRALEGGKAPGLVLVEHFVIGCEKQVLVVILKLVGNLRPEVLIACLRLLVVVGIGNHPGVVVGTRVMVYVDDAIETGIDHVIHNFVDTLQPCLVDIAVGIYVTIPCDWHADGTKASIAHHRHQLWLGDGLSPIGFRLSDVADASTVGIEGVAEVPAHTHVLDGFGG